MKAPDALSRIVAAHVLEATPRLRLNATVNARDVMAAGDFLAGYVRRCRARAFLYFRAAGVAGAVMLAGCAGGITEPARECKAATGCYPVTNADLAGALDQAWVYGYRAGVLHGLSIAAGRTP